MDTKKFLQTSLAAASADDKKYYSPVNVYPCVKVAKTLPASISTKKGENERNCKQLNEECPLLFHLDSGTVKCTS
jgi:hypothetical protein